MMSRLRSLLARLVSPVRRRRLERDLDDDLAAHFSLLVDDLERRGLPPAEARRQARLRFGSLDVAREAHRDARGIGWIEAWSRDARYAARSLRARPGLTLVAVLTLSLGIGTPAAVFGLLDRFVFGTPDVADPDAFVNVVRDGRYSTVTATLAEYQAMSRAQAVRELAAWSSHKFIAPLGADDPSLVTGLLATCNVFRLLGTTTPTAGRLFTPGDCESPAPIAILSERAWRARFGGDPSIVGASLRFGQTPVTIIGVVDAAPILHQWDDAALTPELWLPYSAYASIPASMRSHAATDLLAPSNRTRWLYVGGLLAPGATRAAASAELDALDLAVSLEPDTRRRDPVKAIDGSRWASAPLDMLGLIAMALALPAVLLLLTAVNVAALLLARAAGRQREIGVRLALGASRSSLARLLVAENLILTGLAAGVSFLLVTVVPPLLVRYFDAADWFGDPASLLPGRRVVACVAIASVLSGLLAGLSPMVESLKPRPADALNERRRFGGPRRATRTRRVFVCIQIAACIVPLVTAMIYARAVERYTRPSAPVDALLVAEFTDSRRPALSPAEIATHVEAMAGVSRVALTSSWLPLVFEDAMRVAHPATGAEFPVAERQVSAAFFDTFDVPVVAGRAFDPADLATDPGAEPVIVSEALARRLLGDVSPIGATLQPGRNERLERRLLVVGVAATREVGHAMFRAAGTDGSVIYRLLPETAATGYLLARTRGPAEAAAPAVRERLRALLGTAAQVQPFSAYLEERAGWIRRIEGLFAGLGALSLVLALMGVAGVVSFDALQRRKEIAVRQALGASPGDVRRRIVRLGAPALVAGAAIGLGGAWLLARVTEAERILPSTASGPDPIPYATVGVLMVGIGLATLAAIAYPASRRDPLPVLRED
jgi:putative ABC transport system permease protein